MLKPLSVFTLLLCLVGCKEEAVDPLRLDYSVAPVAQTVHLTLDPDQDSYEGSVEIELDVREKTDSFRFHARNLDIESARIGNGEQRATLSLMIGEKGTVTATAESPLPRGRHTLHLSFRGPYSRKCEGIYKVEYEGNNYLFTQMEPEYARQSFPCWDAPEFKIPWTLQLSVPTNCTAYANYPEQTRDQAGGTVVVTYETSKPMPSYLVAFAVGNFESIPVPGFSTAGRIITPRDKTDLAGVAAEISPPLLRALEAYFEIPHPYPKLDQIAVPEFSYGAMENVGLITYRDTVLLRDTQAMTLGERQWLALTVAHEMAHMWFGNLVTPAWWNDLWLNESFASWMATKIVNQTYPEFEMANNDIKSRQSAFGDDALSTSKPIRRPIAAADDMDHLFDRLAYNKGMAVLNMIEDWMGEEAFRQGMIRYMNDHAWDSADAPALAKSLGGVADGEILDIMTSFVTQAGIPLVTITRPKKGTVQLTQCRYAQLGTTYEDGTQWDIPMTLQYHAEGGRKEIKILLKKNSARISIDPNSDGLHPDANEKGYYRWHMPDTPLVERAESVSSMNERNRIAFISNTEALFSAGLLSGSDFLDTLAWFTRDESPEVRQMVVRQFSDFSHRIVPPELDAAYGRYLQQQLRPMLDVIGLVKQADEHPLVEQLRPELIAALGWLCEDREVLATAATQARAYIKDPYSVDPSLAKTYLRLAAKEGDEALFASYVDQFETVGVPTEKMNYLQGLSAFRDEMLMQRALDYALSDKTPPHQFGTIPYGLADTDENRARVLLWLEKHYDAVAAKVPERYLYYYPWIACGQSPELLETASSFLMTEERKTQGGEVEFEKATAVVRLNRLLREQELDNIKRFLNGF